MMQHTTIFLTNGVKLSGNIVKATAEQIFLERDGMTQLVNKRAIATVMPSYEMTPAELLMVYGEELA